MLFSAALLLLQFTLVRCELLTVIVAVTSTALVTVDYTLTVIESDGVVYGASSISPDSGSGVSSSVSSSNSPSVTISAGESKSNKKNVATSTALESGSTSSSSISSSSSSGLGPTSHLTTSLTSHATSSSSVAHNFTTKHHTNRTEGLKVLSAAGIVSNSSNNANATSKDISSGIVFHTSSPIVNSTLTKLKLQETRVASNNSHHSRSSLVVVNNSTTTSASTSHESKTTSSAKPTHTKQNAGNGPVPSEIIGYEVSKVAVNPKKEGEAILQKYWDLLWKDNAFIDSSTCGSGSGSAPVVWPVAVAFQSFVDGEKASPGSYTKKLSQIYDMMMNYYNTKKKACSASTNKDNDIYYDDNAQIASAMITAYEATKDKKYLNTGLDIVDFLMGGWNDTIGGVTWHLGSPYVASILTTETALACLRLYSHNKDSKYLEFAEKSMKYIHDTLWDKKTDLIFDGESGTKINTEMEFSYQVGTALSAYVKLYGITKKSEYKDLAKKLVKAGINHGLVIYNRDYAKEHFWRDELDFTQLLFEGLADYYNNIDKDVAIKNEVAAQARFVYDFARGSKDGLYFKTVDPLGNDPQIYANWKKVANTDRKSSYKEDGFCKKDVNGTPIRSLITQGAAARIFFLTNEVVTKV